jgi:tRNA threonylcarbamoyl adenosine modification protein YeaZ
VLLAIDTSAGTSVAVLDGESVLAERSTDDTMRHAEVIGGLIAGVLSEAGVAPDEVEDVVAGMGPGPFTGLRVGIAAAKTFAFARGRHIVPIVSHDAVAFGAWDDGARGALLVVTDARRRELYWSAYEITDDGAVRVDGPGLARPDELPHGDAVRLDAPVVSAGALGRVAVRRMRAGAAPEPEEALYLRSPDVTLSAGRKRVTA